MKEMSELLTVKKEKQTKVELVMLEQLVPEDHLLRKIDEHINFDFIYDLVSDKYCLDNGRPSIDPVVLFKMLFIGYLYGIRSERRLSSEIQVNMAYRWFLGLDITEDVPDSSTISQNRRRRFKGTDIPQQIFDNIVQQAIDKGLVSGKTLFSDSTFLKANASKSKFTKEEVTESIKEYIHELDEDVNRERIARNKKLLKKKNSRKKSR
jgi:transposase